MDKRTNDGDARDVRDVDSVNPTAWWEGMTDAEIEREAARLYGDADRFNHLPKREARLTFVGDVNGNPEYTDTLTDADRNTHAHDVKALVASVREALAKVDARNAARGKNRATDYVVLFDALTSGDVEWSRETNMPVMSTLRAALPVNPRTGKAISLQSARERWVRFTSAVQFDLDVWGAFFQSRADAKARAAE